MKIITHEDIKSLKVSPLDAVEWVKTSFELKKSSFLPHKISIVYDEKKFMNTMPVVAPDIDTLGCKIVTRYPERKPAVDGQIFMYDYKSGDINYILDGFWITTARTGAVCALAVQTFAKHDFSTIAIMGLGNTAKASMGCILELYRDRKLTINLLKYKNHCEKFIDMFSGYENVEFVVKDNIKDLVSDADVVISCITCADGILAEPDWLKKGCTLIPVHTKGFQTCDLVFDKIFADDTEHVKGFKYFNQYKNFGELPDVLSGKIKGRENDDERIISYNIGIAMHDIVFAKKIIEMVEAQNIELQEITIAKDEEIEFNFEAKTLVGVRERERERE